MDPLKPATSSRGAQYLRGAHQIRTFCGKVDIAGMPHRSYLRLSLLEMEIVRRQKERNSALTRIRDIDRRLNEIDAEKNVILKDLNVHQDTKPGQFEGNDGTHQGNGILPDRSDLQSSNSGNNDKGTFKIRY